MKHYSQAYTLTEILLAIIIIALLSVMAVTTYFKRADNLKIEKTATEMEILNQAAGNYYIQTGQWPAPNGESTIITDDFAAFIPLKIEKNKTILNPWGYPYIFNGKMWFSTNPNDLYDYKQKFYVKTTLPNPTLAKQLANIMPFTTHNLDDPTNHPSSVSLYSSIPGITPMQNVDAFSLIKTVDTQAPSQGKTYQVDCPAGSNAGLIASLSGFTVDDTGTMPPQLRLIERLYLNVENPSTSTVKYVSDYKGAYLDAHGNYQIGPMGGNSPLRITAITFCNKNP